jgi:hypothetical protein
VPLQRLPRREDPLPDRVLPAGATGRRIDLTDDDIDHAVEEFLLAGHMLVGRHGNYSEFLGEPAHAHRFDPGLVGEGYGGPQHTVPAKAVPARYLDRLSHLYPLSVTGS